MMLALQLFYDDMNRVFRKIKVMLPKMVGNIE